jgi:hypothetical protein
MSNNFYLKVAAISAADQARTLKSIKKSILRNRRRSKSSKAKEKLTVNLGVLQSERLALRRTSRALHLVRAFLRGVPYSVVEGPTTKTTPDMSEVYNWMWDAQSNHSMKEFEEWMQSSSAVAITTGDSSV